MCAGIRFCVHVFGACGDWRRALDTLEMELQVGVSLEPELRSSARKAT